MYLMYKTLSLPYVTSTEYACLHFSIIKHSTCRMLTNNRFPGFLTLYFNLFYFILFKKIIKKLIKFF
jgi:hypothetical protein